MVLLSYISSPEDNPCNIDHVVLVIVLLLLLCLHIALQREVAGYTYSKLSTERICALAAASSTNTLGSLAGAATLIHKARNIDL